MIKHLIIIPIIALQFLFAQESVSENFKWSLGISYQPNETYQYPNLYYEIGYFDDGGFVEPSTSSFVYYPYYYSKSKTAIHFTRSIVKNIWAYFSFNYSSYDIYYRYESRRNYDDEYYIDYEYGSETTTTMNSISLFIGGKIFFKTPKPKRASPYIVLGIGKQLTDYTQERIELFEEDDDGNEYEDNFDEYYEDMNSPFYLFGKVGAEYFFNNSISISAELEMLYEKIKGNYNYSYKYIDQYNNYNYSHSSNRDKKESTITQSALFGLNFYF